MKIKFLLKELVNSLCANKRQTLLTMGSLMIGIMSILLVLGLGNGVQDSISRQIADVTGGEKGFIVSFISKQDGYGFTEKDQERLEGLTSVKKVSLKNDATVNDAILKFNGTGKHEQITYDQISEKTLSTTKDISLIAGRKLTSLTKNGVRTIAIKKELASKLMHAGNILGKQVSVNGTNYDIASIYEGVVETPDVLMSRQAYLMTRGLKDQSNRIKVTYRSSRLRTERAVMNYLNKYGDNSSMGRYQLLNVQQIVSQLNRNTSLATDLIAGVAGISLIVAGFGIMGSTYSSIAERKNEIGLRRAFGAKRKDIRNQFMAEGLLMTITASIIFVVLVKAASLMLGRSLGIPIIITWNNMLVAVLIPNIIGMIFTFFPAMSASKKNVLDLLR